MTHFELSENCSILKNVINKVMESKRIIEKSSTNNTLHTNGDVKKAMEKEYNQPIKVDINILKARAQEIQNKESRKNIFIFISSLTFLVMLAVYLSS